MARCSLELHSCSKVATARGHSQSMAGHGLALLVRGWLKLAMAGQRWSRLLNIFWWLLFLFFLAVLVEFLDHLDHFGWGWLEAK